MKAPLIVWEKLYQVGVWDRLFWLKCRAIPSGSMGSQALDPFL